MFAWIDQLKKENIDIVNEVYEKIKQHWNGDSTINLEEIRESLWSWVDNNGGPQISNEKNIVIVRMILCTAYEDNQELQEMGFFEDLLQQYGLSRENINKYSPDNLPANI